MVVLCAILGIVCIFDYVRGRIPNLFNVALAFWGMFERYQKCSLSGVGRYILVLVVVLLVLYPLFRIGGLGGGDVKLLSVCAGFFPASKIFLFLFVSMLISAVFSIIPLLKDHNIRERAAYFCSYCAAVVRSGKWQLYLPERGGRRARGVCMSGPVLCSVLLYLGGVY